jgi:hypothetical protein
MARYQSCLRALHLFPLIASLQVPTVLSHPFRAAYRETNEARDPDCDSEPPAIPYVSSSSVYEYLTARETPTHPSYGWQPAVNQIGDGQPQAPCTSISGILVSSSIATNYYIPEPRQDTTSGTGTSTTTVFVTLSTSLSGSPQSSAITPTASQIEETGTLQSAVANTIPDSSLTSLTTSEVQTLTEAPATNTSGVSSHPFRELSC